MRSHSLGRLPPIVTSWEIEALKEKIAAAQQGRAFVLQGGDCAEAFDECTSENIVQKLKILLQMSVVIIAGLKRPVVRVGRMAGQYAKPRSDDIETRDGMSLPSYRGDLVNRSPFTPEDREPAPGADAAGLRARGADPEFRAVADRRRLRRSASPGELGPVFREATRRLPTKYHEMVRRVADGLDFFESITGTKIHEARRVDFFASHEGLHLYYEQAQTRFLQHRAKWYDLTTHFPVDRCPHCRAGRGSCGIFPRHRQSDRCKDRAVDHGGRTCAA